MWPFLGSKAISRGSQVSASTGMRFPELVYIQTIGAPQERQGLTLACCSVTAASYARTGITMPSLPPSVVK